MKQFIRNISFSFRRFKLPTAINAAGLALALTAFMVIMMQVYYDRTYNSGISGSDKIFLVYNETADGEDFVSLSVPLIQKIASLSPHVTGYAFTEPGNTDFTFYVNDNAVKGELLIVSPDFPELFGFEMVAGTIDCMEKDNKTIMIPESFARRYFGTVDVIGKPAERNGAYIIGGVYKDFPGNSTLKNIIYRPMVKEWYGSGWTNWGSNSFTMYLKVDDPSAIPGIKKAIDSFYADFSKNDTYKFREGFGFIPLDELHYSKQLAYMPEAPVKQSTEWMLVSIAFLIIAVAIINFANFSNALIPVRIRSINTRKIVGATRLSLVLSLVAETVVTSLAAYVLACLAVQLLSATSFVGITTAGISLSGYLPVTLSTMLIALLTGVLAGIAPALRMTSYSPAVVLKGNFGLSPAGQAIRNVMVGFQFFVSAALIVSAALVQKQRDYMTASIDYGFEKDEIVVCDISYPAKTPEDKQTVVNDLRSLPFVENASPSWSVMAETDNSQGWVFHTPDGENIDTRTLFVGGGYMNTMGIKMAEGRDFNDNDSNAIIFNKLALEKYGENCGIGKELKFQNWFTVVGICDNVIYSSLYNENEPVMFVKMPYSMNKINVRVRKGTNMFQAMNEIRRTLDKYDPGYPFEIRLYDQIMDETYQKEVKFSKQITLFSSLAVLISVMGVMGLVMFDSEYRKREIAVRKVFGSTTSGIVRMFNAKYLRILAVSCILSVPVAWYAINTWMQGFTYRTTMDWWIFALAFAGLAAVTAAVVTWQCRRIAAANPVESLKYE